MRTLKTSNSRRAKIRFFGIDEEFVGTILFSYSEIGVNPILSSNFRFKPDDISKPERLFFSTSVDIVHYL